MATSTLTLHEIMAKLETLEKRVAQLEAAKPAPSPSIPPYGWPIAGMPGGPWTKPTPPLGPDVQIEAQAEYDRLVRELLRDKLIRSKPATREVYCSRGDDRGAHWEVVKMEPAKPVVVRGVRED